MVEDCGFAVTTTSQPAAMFISTSACRNLRLTRFRVTAGPTLLLTERPNLENSRSFGAAAIFALAPRMRSPRESTRRNSAGRRIRCLVGMDNGYGLSKQSTGSCLYHGGAQELRDHPCCSSVNENRALERGAGSLVGRCVLAYEWWEARGRKKTRRNLVGV